MKLDKHREQPVKKKELFYVHPTSATIELRMHLEKLAEGRSYEKLIWHRQPDRKDPMVEYWVLSGVFVPQPKEPPKPKAPFLPTAIALIEAVKVDE